MAPATHRRCTVAARLRLALALAATGWGLLPLLPFPPFLPSAEARPPNPAAGETRAEPAASAAASAATPAASTPPEAFRAPGAGPTPYPGDAAAWPGRGVTRVFGWMQDNRRSFWQQRALKQGSVVFAGDSLVGSWRSLPNDFPALNTANRGIGGDVSRGLLFRFQEDVLDLYPKAIVLLIGTNDLSARQAPADTLFNIAAMLDLARQRDARVPIVLCTLPPRAHRDAPVEPARLAELNAGIKALAAGRAGVTLVDLFEAFSAADGSMDERYFAADRLHLSPAGYARLRSVLEPVLATLRLAVTTGRGAGSTS
ncbi:MAG: hypothetical protein HZC37_00325 [Burkholderiales bacterium]|nr:hypothetical protein [Burkholderiales bacterium]